MAYALAARLTLSVRKCSAVCRQYLCIDNVSDDCGSGMLAGPPGFVHIAADGRSIAWPDYAGNNMFQTLGEAHKSAAIGLCRRAPAHRQHMGPQYIWHAAFLRQLKAQIYCGACQRF